MKKSKQLFLVSIALSAIILMLTVSFQAQPAKITGTWNLAVETGAGSGTPVMVLKQENDTIITGTYTGQLGEAPLKGIIKANNFTLRFMASDMTIEYVGTIDGKTMKGRVVFGTLGEGTFTGTRKED